MTLRVGIAAIPSNPTASSSSGRRIGWARSARTPAMLAMSALSLQAVHAVHQGMGAAFVSLGDPVTTSVTSSLALDTQATS